MARMPTSGLMMRSGPRKSAWSAGNTLKARKTPRARAYTTTMGPEVRREFVEKSLTYFPKFDTAVSATYEEGVTRTVHCNRGVRVPCPSSRQFPLSEREFFRQVSQQTVGSSSTFR